MRHIAFAVFVCGALANAGAFAACVAADAPKPHQAKKPHQAAPCVNFTGVSQISSDLVAREPAPAVKAPGYTPPTSEPYQGPTFNLTKPDPGVKPVPTVGYHWSLE